MKSIVHQSTIALAVSCVLLSACDGAVQLCGEYACLYYQNDYRDDCHSLNFSNSNCNSQPKRCEAASSIRDRAPRILQELRTAQRACSSGLNQTNPTDENSTIVWDESLATLSDAHARDMASTGVESFVGSNGLSTSDRAQVAGIESELLTESIHTGAQTTAEAINAWLDIQTDCEQLVNPQTTRIGMACATTERTNDGPYWSMILAGPEP